LKKLGLQRRIMETARTCILEKNKAMTSDEILKAAPLDLLFENRNKLYGAYPLRKYYHQRLTTAVGISLFLSAGLLFFLYEYNKASGIQFMDRGPDDEVVLRVQHIPEQPVVPEPPQAPQRQKPTPPVAQQRHTTIRITSDPVDVTDVPTQTDLKTTAIAPQQRPVCRQSLLRRQLQVAPKRRSRLKKVPKCWYRLRRNFPEAPLPGLLF
jgi:hypothetical protein